MNKAFKVAGVLLVAILVMAQQPVSVSNTPAVSQSGTWTVQPGNTANTTAWKVDGSAVTQPISGAVTQGAGSGALGTFWYIRESDGTNAVTLDPCRVNANIFKVISQTASAQLVTGTSAKKIYICSINLVTAAANNVAMVEGTGTTCATGIAGMAGGTTAATGWNFAANGGLTEGNGMGSIMAEATNADNLCLLQSAAVQLSGVIGYVVQ